MARQEPFLATTITTITMKIIIYFMIAAGTYEGLQAIPQTKNKPSVEAAILWPFTLSAIFTYNQTRQFFQPSPPSP